MKRIVTSILMLAAIAVITIVPTFAAAKDCCGGSCCDGSACCHDCCKH